MALDWKSGVDCMGGCFLSHSTCVNGGGGGFIVVVLGWPFLALLFAFMFGGCVVVCFERYLISNVNLS